MSVYIYIYIYRERERESHPLTDCFIVSQLFSVARHTGCFKLESKSAYLYTRLDILPLSQFGDLHQLGKLTHFALLDTRVLNSLEELCIT